MSFENLCFRSKYSNLEKERFHVRVQVLYLAMGKKENPNGDHRFWYIFPFTNSYKGFLGTLFRPTTTFFARFFTGVLWGLGTSLFFFDLGHHFKCKNNIHRFYNRCSLKQINVSHLLYALYVYISSRSPTSPLSAFSWAKILLF